MNMSDAANIIISSLISLAIGIAVTFYFSNRRRLSYMAEERRVLDPIGGTLPPEVQIIFSDRPIEKLSEWRIALWNSGNQTILGNEIIAADPIQMIFQGHEVLKVGEVFTSRPAVTADTEIRDKDIKINFSHLDSRDALALTVYTSPLSKPAGKSRGLMKGSIIGVPRGPRQVDRSDLMGIDDFFLVSIGVAGIAAISGFSMFLFLQNGQQAGLFHVVENVNADFVPQSVVLMWITVVGSFLVALAFAMVTFLAPLVFAQGLRRLPRLVREVLEIPSRMSVRRLANLFPRMGL